MKFAKRKSCLVYDYKSDSASGVFDELYQRIDWVANTDRTGGVILKKMEAASALTDNVLSGCVVILACSVLIERMGASLPIGRSNLLSSILVIAFLGISSIVKRAILVKRLDGLLKLLDYDPAKPSRPKSGDEK